MTPSVDPWLRGLRLFVFLAGALIVVGTVVLVWSLFTRQPDHRAEPTAPPPPAAVVEAPPPPPPPPPPVERKPFVADLPLPKGVAVIDLRLEGNRILLLLRGQDAVDYLALVDATTGARLGLVKITAEQP